MRDGQPDLSRLMDWDIPQARQQLCPQQVAFYALSIGIGQQPDDPWDRRLVDPWDAGIRVFPTMPLVMAYPGFWMGDPRLAQATGVNGADILHASQTVRLHAPIAVDAHVTSRSRVDAIVDKGAGRGSLICSTREIRAADDDRLLASCHQVHYLRGVGGQGDMGTPFARLPDIPEAQRHDTCTLPTRPEQALLYRMNGDNNALHFDPDVAAGAGFDAPILHGMCTGAMAAASAMRHWRKAADKVHEIGFRFASPVLPGQVLELHVWPQGQFRAMNLATGKIAIDNGYITFAPEDADAPAS